MFRRFFRKVRKPEPALVTGLVLAIIRLAVGLGWIDHWNGNENEVAVLVDAAMGLAGAVWIRSRVTPAHPDGTPRSDGVV